MKHDSLINILKASFAQAIGSVADKPADEVETMLRPAGDAKFGDYQCNVAMSLAKSLKAKPREIAERIVAAVEPSLEGIAEPLEIAGPGFINIRLRSDFLARYLGEVPPPVAADAPVGRPQSEPEALATGPIPSEPEAQARVGTARAEARGSGEHAPTAPAEARGSDVVIADRVGLPPMDEPDCVVIDYSQPNIAKQMHVGHLRSTVIGDVFARVLAFEGHKVIRQNHIGDWGTQFGVLIRYYREHTLPTSETHDDVLGAIAADYKTANERYNSDEQFAAEARVAVTELQSGQPQARRMWEQMCEVSWQAFTEIYGRMGALLTPEDVCGESFYNDRLQPLVDELREQLAPGKHRQDAGATNVAAGVSPAGWAEVREDQGAVCVFLYDEKGESQFKNPDGDILPVIIQKSDGAFLYATTDLAAIRYRIDDLHATRVIYVTDARQKLHFEMFFAIARAAGWITDAVRVEHVTFGTVMGKNRKPLKTREGTPITLRELLDEAERRAYELLEQRDQGSEGASDHGDGEDLTAGEDDNREIARRVGIAAVKYADLRNDRQSDYVFSWDKMISFQGNTAPYMMYAYARIRSIYRKAAERFGSPDVYAVQVKLAVSEPSERALALRLARMRETIDAVAADLEPHTLCTYLYELAGDFMRFYESCPVLQAPDEPTRLSRMRLCDVTARTLKLGLWLLGIETIERM
ncbi:MAG: arginine--tRNA ligase [Planctomycetota bacterium]